VQGTWVYNAAGENLGSIHDVMIDKKSGNVAYAIMSFGGFLGIGNDYHPLPWSVLRYDTALGGLTGRNSRVLPLTRKMQSRNGATANTSGRFMTTMAWALIGARPHKSRAKGRYVGAASGFQRGAFNAPNEWDGERYRRDCVAAPPRCRKRPIAVGCPAAFGRAVHEHHCWSRPISAVVLVRTPGDVQQRKFTIGELLRAGHHSSPRDARAVLCAGRKASQSRLFRMLDTSGSPAFSSSPDSPPRKPS
jgi:hypothetical protein